VAGLKAGGLCCGGFTLVLGRLISVTKAKKALEVWRRSSRDYFRLKRDAGKELKKIE